MKTLLIMRHAKSSWKNARLADHDRPLSKRGKRDAPRMGRHLQSIGLVPDLIISSSAERALCTAESVAIACGYDSQIAVTRHFYHADPDDYVDFLSELDEPADILMIVGHNPGLEELVEELVGAGEHMPTGAVAQVALHIDEWRDLSFQVPSELVNYWEPKALPP